MESAGVELKGETSRVVPERWILLLLAAVQFTHIMDFMVMMPLGPQLMRELDISPQQFGALISSFAITAGVVGLLAAPFLDRFDRKKLLLFCYAGFALATLFCGLAHRTETLLVARALCGAFGGVSGATIMAIVSDIVPPERRARGMGIIMIAFSVASAIGVPLGLMMAHWWQWEAPFIAISALAAIVWVCLWHVLPPVKGHLAGRAHSFGDFLVLLKDGNAWRGLLLMTMIVFGHFTIIPFLPPFLVGNAGVAEKHLFLIYLVGGVVSIFTGPWLGRMSDRFGNSLVYTVLVVIASCVIWNLSTHGARPLWEVLVIAALFFAFASGRFIPAQAAASMAVPSARRGAYMSLLGCSRDLASGITTSVGGMVIVKQANGALLGFNKLGGLAILVSFASLLVIRTIKRVS
jgi:DHA1 family inner membrane transport protein